MSNITLTEQQIADFHRDGYVIARGYYSLEEIDRLQEKAFNDDSLNDRAWHKKDAGGAVSLFVARNR